MDIGTILMLALTGIQLAQSLFGKKDQTATQTTTELPRGYQSPFLGLADMYTLGGGANRNAAYEGWGWPEGQGPRNPFGEDFMSSLMQAWPEVLSAYAGKGTIPVPKNKTTVPKTGLGVGGSVRNLIGRAPLI